MKRHQRCFVQSQKRREGKPPCKNCSLLSPENHLFQKNCQTDQDQRSSNRQTDQDHPTRPCSSALRYCEYSGAGSVSTPPTWWTTSTTFTWWTTKGRQRGDEISQGARNEKWTSSVYLVDLISHQSLAGTEEKVDDVSKQAVAVQRVGTSLVGGWSFCLRQYGDEFMTKLA